MSRHWHTCNYVPTNLNNNTKPTNNKVYVMYHGTSRKNANIIKEKGFKRSTKGMLGAGVYVSRDPRKALRYPLKGKPENRVVLELLVNVGMVKKINRQGHPMQKTWHKHGYDTAWVPPACGMVDSLLEEDCVWDPKRIKVLDILEPDELNSESDEDDDDEDDDDEEEEETSCEDEDDDEEEEDWCEDEDEDY
ncbi:calsequestrin-2-like isoform X1 [Polypterus senegalus]|uniref:calsequestrin-2-like isoform X1 n=1 Tax=Polypterus senegalus TaxID=55291 RepID=UPI0019628FB2|nr:calsequestrin-2-like isoform X1 [Polypterus senegalus]XP_039607999.1 calsequestrin-2-like isoform X1 [Polypterus senegalus]